MSNVVNLHRSTELPDEWYADNCPVDYDRNPRFDGPARHIVIRPAIPIRQILVMCAAAVFIGFCVAGAF